MANTYLKIHEGLTIKPDSTAAAPAAQGEMNVNTSSGNLRYHNGSVVKDVVTETNTLTLTNKTLDAAANTISNLVDANIKTGAAIAYSKLALTGSIVNADINTSAAIDYSKLALTGSIVNADVNASAAIAYSKLALTGSIVNADINASAAIAYSKLALTGAILNADLAGSISRSKIAVGSFNQVLINDGSGNLSSEAQLAGTRGGTGVNNSGTLNFGSNALTLSTSGTTNVTLPTSGTVATLAGTETLSNKTFGDSIISTQIATPSTPSSGFSKIYSKSDGFFYQLDPNGTERKIGTGSGGINYITNPDAEGSTTGWATYADAAANVPVDGTGGTATNLTFSRTTSSPLRGTGSFQMAQANSTSLQGKGVSYDFTIDSADQAKVLVVSFDFNASSTFVTSDGKTAPLNDGTTTTNAGNSDIEVFLYDVTNAALIYPTPQVFVSKGSNNFNYSGTFQTASNSTSYRLIYHIATTSANATGWTFKFDNVVVGPQTLTFGAPISDPVAYTPTITGFGSATSVNFVSWRNGSYLFVEGTFTAGTATATEAQITLGFNGVNSNVSTLSTLPTLSAVGLMKGGTASSTFFTTATVTAEASKTYLTLAIDNSSNNGLSKSNGSAFTNSVAYSFFAKVPINGWSSNIQLSQDTASRIVAAAAIGVTATVTGSYSDLSWATVNDDTHGAFNATSSATSYTIPVSGFYDFTGQVLVSATTIAAGNSFTVGLLNNTSSTTLRETQYVFEGTNTTSDAIPFNYKNIKLTAGTVIKLQIKSNTTSPVISASTTQNFLSVTRVSGPQTIASSEYVAAHYWTSAATTPATGVQINFDTKNYDTHSAVTTGAGAWKFTTPVSGLYRVAVELHTNGTSGSGNIQLYKNGTLNFGSIGPISAVTNTVTTGYAVIKLVAGDFIDIRSNGGTPSFRGAATLDGTDSCMIFIEKADR